MCKKTFQSKQGLSSHVMWAHPVAVGANIKSEAALKVAKSQIPKKIIFYLKVFIKYENLESGVINPSKARY